MPETDGDSPQTSSEESTIGLMAWAFYDWANSSFPTIIQTFVFAAYFTENVAADATSGSALWGNAVGIAGVLVALGGPILGAIADQNGRRKPWIGVFTVLCALSTALLWFVKPSPEYVPFGLIFLTVGIVSVEYAIIFYNSMLPSLAPDNYIGRWSGWGWAIGYAGGLLSLVCVLFLFVRHGSALGFDTASMQHVRAAFPFVGAWFLVFSIPLFLYTSDERKASLSFKKSIKQGLYQLYDSIRHITQYGNILKFLLARMLYADALATIFSFGGVYAAGTFDMGEQEILIFGIALNVSAGLGAAGFSWIDDRIGGKRTIICSLVGLLVFGFLILIVHTKLYFFVFGFLLGIFVGPAQSAGRSYYSRIVPDDMQTEMFGLYAFSGKATAFVGPFMVGWITYLMDSQRWGMSFISLLLLLSLILILTVSSDRPTHN